MAGAEKFVGRVINVRRVRTKNGFLIFFANFPFNAIAFVTGSGNFFSLTYVSSIFPFDFRFFLLSRSVQNSYIAFFEGENYLIGWEIDARLRRVE